MYFKILTISLIAILLTGLLPQNFADSKVVVIETKFGNMTIEFFPQDAPKTVDNFIKLAESGFYDGTRFHRIISGFMIQGGDPLSKDNEMIQRWGTGNAEQNVDAEFNNIKHLRGVISMARSADPNSASSQFFIVHKDSTFLDKQYTVFGRLITQESFDVLDKIAALETNHNPTSGAPADSPLNYDDAEVRSIKIIDYSEVQNPLTLSEPERIIPLSTIDENNNYSTKLGFSFHIPEGWTVQEPPKSQPRIPDVVTIGPLKDGFTPAISALAEDKKGETLENHIKNSRKDIQQFIDNGAIDVLAETTENIDGQNIHTTLVKSNFTSSGMTFILKYKEIIMETDDKFYTLTFVDQEKNFDANLQIFDAVLDSFETTQQENKQMDETEVKENKEVPKSEQANNSEQIKSEGTTNFPPAFAIGIGIAAIAGVAVIIVTKMRNKPKSQNSTPQSE